MQQKKPIKDMCWDKIAGCSVLIGVKDRLTKPLLRKKDGKYDKEGEFAELSWDEAMDTMADKWKAVLKDKGPSGVGIFCYCVAG